LDDYNRPSNFLDAPVEDSDDLTKLPGIGVASQKQFNEMGVYYYRQFEEWDGADWDYVEAYVETQLNGRVDVDRATIMRQAVHPATVATPLDVALESKNTVVSLSFPATSLPVNAVRNGGRVRTLEWAATTRFSLRSKGT